MQTKIFEHWEDKKVYVDKSDFLEKVKNNELEIQEEYPNEKIKLCTNGICYELMDEKDWIIEVYEWVKCRGQSHKYQLHSNIGRFPTEPIATYTKAFRWRNDKWRYREDLIEWVEYEENWWSANLYTNELNGEWRKKMIDAWFKVVNCF